MRESGGRGAVRVGLIGCGPAGRKHLRLASRVEGIRVAALCDMNPQALAAAATAHGIVRLEADYRAPGCAPDLEAIVVCAPVEHHEEIALAVMAAGKHLLVEKPLALSLDACDRLVSAAARRSDRVSAVGFHMRTHRQAAQARRMLADGRLGQIEMIRGNWNSPSPFDGSLADWRRDRTRGGGALVEIGVHLFDLWRWLSGGEVDEVFAFTRADGPTDETVAVTGRLDNGVLAAAMISERSSHQIEVEILGRGGRLRLDCLRFDGLEFTEAAGVPGGLVPRLRRGWRFATGLPRALSSVGDYLESYEAEWRSLADAVRGRPHTLATLEDGRRATRIALAAAESAASGKPVRVQAAPRTMPPFGSR